MTVSTPLLAALVTPALFYGGAAAVSLPIIIHLLSKRRFKRVRWAAMEFLLEAERENRRKINFQELLLLLLRCLAVFLLGLLLARPYVMPGHLAGILSGSTQTRHIVLLDDSFSMGFTSAGRSAFDRGRSAVLRLVENLQATSGQDRLTLYLSSQDEPIIAAEALGEMAPGAVRDRLEQQPVSQRPARMAAWTARLRETIMQEQDQLATIIYVFSDFQRNEWIPAKEGETAQVSCLHALGGWPDGREAPSIVLVPIGEPERDNLAIVELRADQAQLVWGVENRLIARVANLGRRPSEPIDMRTFIDEAAGAVIEVPAIAPGGHIEVAFSQAMASEGPQAVRVETPPDNLELDNARCAVFDVLSALQVLVINGEPSVYPIQDEVALLETALDPEGEVTSGVAVTVLDEAQFETAALEQYHLVILANVFRLGEPAVDRLEEFVASGGGLAIFLGDQVERTAYNTLLWKDGAGLLPCPLGEIVATPAGQRPAGITVRDESHPMVRVLVGEENPLRSGLSFWQFTECVPPVDGTGPTAAIAANYDEPLGRPAVIEQTVGKGRVLVMTSTCDQEWNDWAKSPSYVVAMLELVHHLARRGADRPAVLVGDEVRIEADTETFDQTALWQTPDYPREAHVALRAQPQANDAYAWMAYPDEVGIHQLIRSDIGGGESIRPVAVNPDPGESDVYGCTERELRQAAPDVPFSYVSDSERLAGLTLEHGREIWPAILLAVVLVLMVEQFLGYFFGRL